MAKPRKLKDQYILDTNAMATLLNEYDTLIKNIKSDKILDKSFSKPEHDGGLGDILKQRHFQRIVIFWFAIGWAFILLSVLVLGVILQSYMRIHNQTFNLLDPSTFNVLAVSILGQFIGVILVISKSLWDDKAYTPILPGYEQKNHKKK